MYTVTFDDGKRLKLKTDEIKWSPDTHKFFNPSLKPIIITLLCIQKYHFRHIDKNIFFKIISESVDISYLLDFNLFLDFVLTNQKRYIFNTYEHFRCEKYNDLFNCSASRQVNPKDIKDWPFTRGVKDITETLEEIAEHKILGLIMIFFNTIEITYMDVSKNISTIDLSFDFDFYRDLDKKKRFYDLLRSQSITHTNTSHVIKPLNLPILRISRFCNVKSLIIGILLLTIFFISYHWVLN